MAKPTLEEMARVVARQAPLNVSYEDAFKYCKAKHKRMSGFNLSVMAGWVVQVNARGSD